VRRELPEHDGEPRPGARVLLLTGRPGVGKTTVVRRVAAALGETGVGGFYSEEIRGGGTRRGFRLATFAGHETAMAGVGFRGPRVGKYGVDVAAVEALVGPALAEHDRLAVYLVDEIGKMECLAPGFVRAMRRLLASPRLVVATVALRGGGLIAEVKARPDAQVWEVTRNNRDAMPQQVLQWLRDRGIGSGPTP
jgi:nucleoside-triphosphatase